MPPALNSQYRVTRKYISINNCAVELIPYGYCGCGCGQKTSIAKQSHSKYGWVKGQPLKYASGHNNRGRGTGRSYGRNGSVMVVALNHPNSFSRGRMLEHVLIAENVLGKILPTKAVIHHVDENPANNANNNLVICQDENYHRLLHRRLRAYQACGNASYRKCQFCKEYDDLDNLVERDNHTFHQDCKNAYQRRIRNKVW